jgi:hypothetical protein
VRDGAPGEQKHQMGEPHGMGEPPWAGGEVQPGRFFILVAKASALVWEVKKRDGANSALSKPKGHQPQETVRWPCVNPYSFPIWD